MTRRAVVTGVGVVTPIGIGEKAFWASAVSAKNGVTPIESFDTSDFRTKVGGEIRDFHADQFLSAAETRRMDRSSQFAVAAAKMALFDSGLNASQEDPYRMAVCMGTTMGEPQVLERGIEIKYQHADARRIPSDLPGQYPCNVIPANLARELGCRGTAIMIPTACAAGNYALGYAFDLIKLGKADVVFAGGSDPLSKIAFTGFNRLLATSEKVCRPFDKNRDGMAVGEGAGVLIVEDLDHARKRNAPIHAEILGYGLGCDAHKMTIPDPSGSGGILAMRRALHNAGIAPEQVDYISAHGTGTGENDKTETAIIKSVFGERAYRIPISSLKSMIGHTMGAASAIEAAACVMIIKNKTLLPTANYTEPDPECDLDYVPNTAREAVVNIAISNAYAFGGNTSSLVVARYNG